VPQAFTYHKRSCEKTKKRLSGALEKAKEVWQANKRRRMEEKVAKDSEALGGPSHLDKVPVPIATPSASSEVRFLLFCFATTLTISNN
jgi:hypothetical protein